LSPFTGCPVQDRAGLAGDWDFQLEWTPDRAGSNSGGVELLNGIPLDSPGPSVFSAVREQLGLKLEPGTGAAEILVIDSATEPEN
jgi:uncharacterized protein (TIGR03435 family)